MFSTTNVADSFRKVLEQVKVAVATRKDARQKLEDKKAKLVERRRVICNQPLSMAALKDLYLRSIDVNAKVYKERFKGKIFPEVLEVPRSENLIQHEPTLVLADVRPMMHQGHAPVRPERGALSLLSVFPIRHWMKQDNLSICFFFGDIMKSKLDELFEGAKLPYKDDGKSLKQREDELEAVEAQIAEVDAQIAVLDVELKELQENHE